MDVREILTKYCESKEWDTDDDNLIEALLEAKTVQFGDMDEHRWYICQQKVKQIGESFISFTDYIITGDNSMRDMDLEYDLDSARVVERKERVVTEYYYE